MYNVAFVSEALVRKEKIQAALRKMVGRCFVAGR